VRAGEHVLHGCACLHAYVRKRCVRTLMLMYVRVCVPVHSRAHVRLCFRMFVCAWVCVLARADSYANVCMRENPWVRVRASCACLYMCSCARMGTRACVCIAMLHAVRYYESVYVGVHTRVPCGLAQLLTRTPADHHSFQLLSCILLQSLRTSILANYHSH
jgi:hypothetical protein